MKVPRSTRWQLSQSSRPTSSCEDSHFSPTIVRRQIEAIRRKRACPGIAPDPGDHCHPGGRSHQFRGSGTWPWRWRLTGIGGDASASPSLFLCPRRLRDGSRLGTNRYAGPRGDRRRGRGREPGCLTRAAIRVLHERLKPVLCRIAGQRLMITLDRQWSRIRSLPLASLRR